MLPPVSCLLLTAAAHAGSVPPLQITEVLFNVPNDQSGDANKDGERHAAGDEFIEIANPSDEPVNLKGYVIFNRRASFDGREGNGVRFAFPDMVLPAHGVCVVFNACDATLAPPFGTSLRAPESGHDAFAGAMIFSMENSSTGRALANGGDWIALAAPDGTILDCVSWGEPKPPPPAARRSQKVDANPKGSVQRLAPETPLEAHRTINGAPCSPGSIPARGKGSPKD